MNSKFSTLTLSSHTPGRDLVCRLKKLFSCQLTQTNQNELLVTIYVFAEYFNLKFMLVNLFLYYAVVNALHKCWCVQHFTCIGCNISLNLKSKFHEFDMQPLCKKCYEKMPLELKKRLKKAEQTASRK